MPQRKALLALARDRLENFYADKSNLEEPKESDGVTFRLSRADKSCSGDLVPLTFLEFDVKARPVDVFNVLLAAENRTQWDTAPSEMRLLGEWKKYQARGVVGFFEAKPLSTREIYEWQVASANFTSQEFWVVYSTLQNHQLRSQEPLRAGATEMQNCLCAYRITLKDGGAHVLNTQQVNEHPWPLSARSVANLGWQTSAAFGSHLREQSRKQLAMGWVKNRSVAPAWMLKDEDCVLERPDESLREGVLLKAEASLNASWESPQLVQRLSDGQEMSLWQEEAACGGAQAPRFRAEFTIGAPPREVFHALAAKRREAQWNGRLLRLNVTGLQTPGVRGLHEEFSSPSVLGLKMRPRELFEWQAANSTFESYLVAFNSHDATGPSFEGSVTAMQCIAAYEVVPAAAGARVRLVQHVNAKVGLAERLRPLWEKKVIEMLNAWASEVSEEARNLVAQRHCGQASCVISGYDPDLLELLSPSPLRRDFNLTVADVLAKRPWQRSFAQLPLSTVLNVSRWADFRENAREVMRLFMLVEANASSEEKRAFAAPAHDALEVQRQGQALAALQWRQLEALRSLECNASLPDINGDKGHRALPFWALVVMAVALLVALLGCVACGVGRLCRLRRERQARQAASLLLSASCAPHSEASTSASQGERQ